MKDTAKKNRPKEAARSPLRTTLGELATRTQLELELEALVRRDLREFVISAGISALTAVLEEERTQAVGPRYAHLPTRRAHRAGTAPGELVMGGRRVQVRRPRARTLAGKEIQLPSWTTFGAEDPLEQRAVEQMLVGVSTRRYARSLEPLPEKLPTRGTSRSAVSRRFVAATERQMAEWLGRDVSELDLGVLMIDGVTIDNHVLLVALGIDADGKKHVLGVREGATENAAACTALLADLRERGLRTDRTTLVVIDGSKALAKAVRHVFGDRAIVQRCQAHYLESFVIRSHGRNARDPLAFRTPRLVITTALQRRQESEQRWGRTPPALRCLDETCTSPESTEYVAFHLDVRADVTACRGDARVPEVVADHRDVHARLQECHGATVPNAAASRRRRKRQNWRITPHSAATVTGLRFGSRPSQA